MSDHADPASLGTPRHALLWAMLSCAIAALTLAHPAITGGFLVSPHSDQYIAGYAFREFAATFLRETGQFPQWNPYLMGGMPYIDAMHGDIFYPTFLLRLLFSTDAGMTWGMILHLWLAGVAAYGLFRSHGLPFHAALVGGIGYMMSGMVAGLVSPGHDGKLFICALLPLMLLVLRQGIRYGRHASWGLVAVVAGLGVLTPHPQLFQYMLLASGAYALFIAFGEGGEGKPTPRQAAARLGLALGGIGIGFLIGAIQFWPVLNYVNVSPRAGGAGWEHAISYSMPPEEIVNTFLPQFSGILDNYWGRNGIHLHSEYLGLPLLLLVGAAFAGKGPRGRFTWFWLGVLVVSGLWALGGFTPFYRLVYAIVPGTKFFRAPSTMMYVTALSVSALAAIGASRVLAGEVGRKTVVVAASVVGVLGLMGLSGAFSTMFAGVVPPGRETIVEANQAAVRVGAVRMLVFAGLAIVLIQATITRRVAVVVAGWLFAALVLIDQWSVARNYWIFSPRASEEFASDQAIDAVHRDSMPGRVWNLEYPRQTRDPFLNYDGLMAHGVRTVFGYHGNALRRYEEFLQSESGVNLTSPGGWAMANVRWIYTNLDTLPFAEFERVLGPVENAYGSRVYLYRSREENPLAWVVPLALKAPDEISLATLAQPGYPVRSVAIFEPEAGIPEREPATPPPLDIRARTTHYAPGSIDIELSAPAPEGAALVVSENFYPGWRAQVDGRDAAVARANYTLIGVPLAAGAQRIQLRFQSLTYPTGKRITILATIAALVLAAGGYVIDRRRA